MLVPQVKSTSYSFIIYPSSKIRAGRGKTTLNDLYARLLGTESLVKPARALYHTSINIPTLQSHIGVSSSVSPSPGSSSSSRSSCNSSSCCYNASGTFEEMSSESSESSIEY